MALRLSRSFVIQDLELLVNDSASLRGRFAWTTRGVDCTRERFSHGSAAYSFDLDVLKICSRGGASGPWELFIVTEFWRSSRGTPLHSPKWLKLVRGDPNDVRKWIAANRNAQSEAKPRSTPAS